MARVVAIANQKGGVGKTSTSVNFAAALTRAGRHVLLVDLDPQASLTEYFLDPQEVAGLNETTYTMLKEGKAIQAIPLGDQISLLPATIDLAAAEIELPAKRNSERLLARLIKQYTFDYCIIDCPPSLGILTTNALAAAQIALIPVATEIMAERTVKLILATIADVRETELNTSLNVWRILPTIYDSRLAHHKEILAALRAKHGDLLYDVPVKSTTKYKDAVTNQVDVSELDAVQGQFWDTLASAFLREYEGVR